MATELPTVLRERLPDRRRILLAVAAGVGGLAGSYAVASFTPNFVAGPIAGELARRMPAIVVAAAIVLLGDIGAQLNVFAAISIAVVGFAVIVHVGLEAGRWADVPAFGPLLAGLFGAVFATIVTGAQLPSLVAGLAIWFVLAVAQLASVRPVTQASSERRRLLGGLAASLGVSVASLLFGRRGPGSTRAGRPLDVPDSVRLEIENLLAEAETKSLDVAGLESLVSEDFYEVDINATNPIVSADEWRLRVTGAVEEELTLTYADVRAMEPEHRFVSLRCVGESLNGRKMDNALWTGVPVMDVISPAAPAEECCVMLRAVDGYYEEFGLPALRRGFLAYGMNGNRLPRGHGYPVRALIPGHWGEINVKWLSEIEVLRRPDDGYWEERGWEGTGPVETVAKLHLVDTLEDGRMRVGGHAYAGTRGVGGVEVSVDGGGSWSAATLSEPLPGEDVWRQWLYEYDPPSGAHEVVVRAIEADGTVQPSEPSGAFPDGPSGWVSRTVRP